MRSMIIRIAFLCALGFTAGLSAATYEVAPSNPLATDDGAGTVDRPFKSISKAADRAKAGDVIRVRAGVYRERVVVKASGTKEAPIRVEAVPGEHVVVTGADQLRNWKRNENGSGIYTTDWPHKFIGWNITMTHPADEYHKVIGRCEQIMVSGYLLRQVLSQEQLAPGTFFADVTNKVLHVWDTTSRDLNKLLVEGSTRQEILRIEGDHLQVRGLTFRYAANMAQHGAVVLAGKSNLMEDCLVEQMNSSGALFQGEDAVVRRSAFRDNGQLGFSANRAHRLLFTECLVENNNLKNFDRGWEAGGNKLVLCADAVLERSRFVRNRGNGIWFDIGNTNCTVRQCLIADNEDAGIFYEISYALRAHDNVIIRNGFAQTTGAWGAQSGISLSSSPGCLIERNIIVGNREGFNFREQNRTTPTIEDRTERPIWNQDQVIRNNIIACNRDAQIWGWFDVKDNRHWRGSGQEDLTLEKLNLKFAGNIYFANPGQGWFNWGSTWSRHEKFGTLESFQRGLQIDTGSEAREIAFRDLTRLDFRIPTDPDPLLKACYPTGRIPGVVTGILGR